MVWRIVAFRQNFSETLCAFNMLRRHFSSYEGLFFCDEYFTKDVYIFTNACKLKIAIFKNVQVGPIKYAPDAVAFCPVAFCRWPFDRWPCVRVAFSPGVNKCIKLFFGYSRYYSVTQMLLELGLPSFNTILVNGLTVFNNLQMNCANALIVIVFAAVVLLLMFFLFLNVNWPN